MGEEGSKFSKKPIASIDALREKAEATPNLYEKSARYKELIKSLKESSADIDLIKETERSKHTAKISQHQKLLDERADLETFWESQDQAKQEKAKQLKKQNRENKKRQEANQKEAEQEQINLIARANELRAEYKRFINRLKDLQNVNTRLKYETIIKDMNTSVTDIQAYLEDKSISSRAFEFLLNHKTEELKTVKKANRRLLRKYSTIDADSSEEEEVKFQTDDTELPFDEETDTQVNLPFLEPVTTATETTESITTGEQVSEEDKQETNSTDQEISEEDEHLIVDYRISDPDLEEDLPLSSNSNSEGSLFDELNEVEAVVSPSQENLSVDPEEETHSSSESFDVSNISKPKSEPDDVVEDLEELDEEATSTLLITEQELQLLVKRIESVEEYDASQTSSLYKQVEELIERAQAIPNIIQSIPIYNAAIDLLKTDITRQDQISDTADNQREELDYIITELGRGKNTANRNAIAILSEKADHLETNNNLRAAASTQAKQKILEIEELVEGTKKSIEQDFIGEQLKLKAQREKEDAEKAQLEKEHRKKLQQEKKEHQKEQASLKQQKLGLVAEAKELINRQNRIRKNIETSLRQKNPDFETEYDNLEKFLKQQTLQLEALIDLANNAEGETETPEGLVREKEFNAVLREFLDARTKEFDVVMAVAHKDILKVRSTKSTKHQQETSAIVINSTYEPAIVDNAFINPHYSKKPFSDSLSKLTDKQNAKNNETDSEPNMQNQQNLILRVEKPLAFKKPHAAQVDIQVPFKDKEPAAKSENANNKQPQAPQQTTLNLGQRKEYDPSVNVKQVEKIVPQIPQLFHYTTSFFHVTKKSTAEMQSHYPTAYKVDAPDAPATDVRKKSSQVNPKPVVIMPMMPYPMTLSAPLQSKPQLQETANNKPQVEVITETPLKPQKNTLNNKVVEATFANRILDLCHDDIPSDYFNLNKDTLNRELNFLYHTLGEKPHVLKRKIQVQCITEAFEYILNNYPMDNKLPFSKASGLWSLLAANNKELSNQQLKLIGVLKLGLIQLTQEMVDEKMDTKDIREMLFYAIRLINFTRGRFHEPYYTNTGNEISNILARAEYPFSASFS